MDARIANLLKKYFYNQANEAESIELQNWLAEQGYENQLDEIVEQLYLETSNEKTVIDADSKKIWNNIATKVDVPTPPKTVVRELPNQKSNPYWRVAAVVTLLLVSWLAFTYKSKISDEQKIAEVKWISRATALGEKLSLTLPDGSKIKVNAGSKVRFAENFLESDTRIIYLEGESFFDVAKMPSKPFKVITGNVETTVLGTSFNVHAYPLDNKVQIAVLTGKVNVKNETAEVNLTPDEMATLKDTAFVKTGFNREEIFGWKDGKLIFNKSTFDEVLSSLEKWYGVEFIVQDEKIRRKQVGTFTAQYQNESLETVLKGIAYSGKFNFKIEGKKVLLSNK